MQSRPRIDTTLLPPAARSEFADMCAAAGAFSGNAPGTDSDVACFYMGADTPLVADPGLQTALGRMAGVIVLAEDPGSAVALAQFVDPGRCLEIRWPAPHADAVSSLREFLHRIGASHPAPLQQPGAPHADAGLSETLEHAGIRRWEWTAATGTRRFIDHGAGRHPSAAPSLEDLIDPEQVRRDRAFFEQAVRARSAYRNEVDIHDPARGRLRMLLTATPRCDARGDVVSMDGIAQDVSERHAREVQLGNAQRLLLNSLQAGKMFCWEWNLETGARHTFGPSESIVGTSIDTIEQSQATLHPDDRENDDALVARTLAEGVPYQNEFRVIRPDGQLRWMVSHGELVRDEAGKGIRLSGIAIDITDRRAAELEFEDSSRRLGLAMRAAKLNPWSVDLATEAHIPGPLDVAFYGDSVDSKDAFLRHVHPDDQALVARMRDPAFLRSQRPEEFTFRVNHADGRERWIRVNAQSVCDAKGTPVQLVGISKDVTDVHLVTERLQRTQDQIDSAQLASNMALWEWTHRDGIRYFREGGRLLPRDEVPSVHPEDFRRVAKAFLKAIRERQSYHDQFRILRASGALEWVKIQAHISRNERVTGDVVSGVMMDITPQHEAAEKLASTQRRLVRALDAGGMFDWELRLPAPHSVGGPPPDLPTAKIFGHIHPADTARHVQALAEALNGTTGRYQCELRALDRRGRYTWLLITGQRDLDESGNAIGLSGVALDIGDRKIVESMLIESREWQRLAVGAADLNLWRIDLATGHRQGGDLDWRLYGHAPESISELMRFIHPEDLQIVLDALDNAAKAGLPYQIEYRLQSLTDGMRWVRDRGEVVDSNQNGRRYLAGITMDITEQRQADDAHHRALALAQEASEAKSGFLAAMSHELRTPLNAVVGFSSLLQATENPDTRDAHLHALQQAAHQLMSVINDVLDFSRIEANALKLESARFSLSECISGALNMVAAAAEDKGLCLMFVAHDAQGDMVVGDMIRTRQIALNLLSNAVKFTERGAVRASLGLFRADGRVQAVLGVSDTGIGMTRETIDRLFEPFRQGDDSTVRRFGGSGLGLSICRRLVDMMGGSIEVESIPGEGSRFLVRLTLEATGAPEHAVRRPLTAHRIGVCIKSAYLRSALRDQLREYGADVVEIPPTGVDAEALTRPGPLSALVAGEPVLPELSRIVDWPAQQQGGKPLPLVALVGIDTPLTERMGANGQRIVPIARALRPRMLLKALLQVTNQETEPSARPSAATSWKDEAAFDGLRVMIVEDNDINRELLSLQLESLGIDNLIAESGEEAIALHAREPCEIILMDVEMPGMDGMQATASLLDAIPHGQARPYVIAVTAHVFGDTRDRMRQAGMDDFVSKPVVMNELVDALRRGRNAIGMAAL